MRTRNLSYAQVAWLAHRLPLPLRSLGAMPARALEADSMQAGNQFKNAIYIIDDTDLLELTLKYQKYW